MIAEQHSHMWNIFVQRFVWPGFTAAITFAGTEFWAVQTLKDTVHDHKMAISELNDIIVPQLYKDIAKEIVDRKEVETLKEKRIEYIVGIMEADARSRAAQTEQITKVIGLFELQRQIKQ